MDLVLDTHVFIWSYRAPESLSHNALQALSDPANNLFLSVASIWEIQIKIQIGKIEFDDPLSKILEEQQLVNGINFMPIEISHAQYLENLPFHHKDPFDRMLIAQALVEDMTIVGRDARFSDYGVKLLW
jgi:PIN domain nuclease of toxin-antitoxin system